MGRRVKIANRRLKIEPLPARESLRMVVTFSKFMHDVAPELALMADPSRQVRTATALKIVKEREDLPELLFELVSTVTAIPISELEEEATLSEMLNVISKTIKINDWDVIWTSAMRLRIIDRFQLYDWLWARIPKLRVR
ncbi:MAG: hypothetical protein ACXABY_05710 [Candidatus Thorarchaeota archaeon]|jgi:hypothetical protein